MDEKTYDPVFARKPVPNHEGECQFVRTSRLFEGCSLPGCPVGRYSRDWINGLKRAHSAGTSNG